MGSSQTRPIPRRSSMYLAWIRASASAITYLTDNRAIPQGRKQLDRRGYCFKHNMTSLIGPREFPRKTEAIGHHRRQASCAHVAS
jgi:hypothetical protein